MHLITNTTLARGKHPGRSTKQPLLFIALCFCRTPLVGGFLSSTQFAPSVVLYMMNFTSMVCRTFAFLPGFRHIAFYFRFTYRTHYFYTLMQPQYTWDKTTHFWQVTTKSFSLCRNLLLIITCVNVEVNLRTIIPITVTNSSPFSWPTDVPSVGQSKLPAGAYNQGPNAWLQALGCMLAVAA